jgi:hypothetical protein
MDRKGFQNRLAAKYTLHLINLMISIFIFKIKMGKKLEKINTKTNEPLPPVENFV